VFVRAFVVVHFVPRPLPPVLWEWQTIVIAHVLLLSGYEQQWVIPGATGLQQGKDGLIDKEQ
jgi:hypothetical protein